MGPTGFSSAPGNATEERIAGHRAVSFPVVARPRGHVVGVLVSHGIIRPHANVGTVAQVDTRGEIVNTYLASFTTGDPDAVAACVTADFVNEHLSELEGARYTILTRAEIATPGAGDVVVRYRFEATFEGTAIDIPGVMWFDVSDGLVARRTDLWDSLTFLRQTGQSD